MKQCTKCGNLKPFDAFFSRKRSSDGLTPMCKECYTVARRSYYERNKGLVLRTNRRSYAKNRVARIENQKGWKEVNHDKVLEYKRNYNSKRRSDISEKIRDRVSASLRRALKHKRTQSAFDVLPYTKEQLVEHLTKTLPRGYTMDDFAKGLLHIDHIIPVSAFNITSMDSPDFQRCWALKNLRLLPAHDNLVKWNKLEKPFQPSLDYSSREQRSVLL